ncbi:hypothetical protein B7P43_G07642, partial [Cryptotermes secundus]
KVHAVILFLHAKGGTAAEIHRQLLSVYGEDVMNKQNMTKCCPEFKKALLISQTRLQNVRLVKCFSFLISYPRHVSSHLIQVFQAKHGIPQVRQAPYSPDMGPCDFWLFPRLKFDSREDIIQNKTAQLHAIPKEAFQNCFQRWKDLCAKCVESQGAYFEGD